MKEKWVKHNAGNNRIPLKNGSTTRKIGGGGTLRKTLCTVLAMVIAAGAVMVAAPKTARAETLDVTVVATATISPNSYTSSGTKTLSLDNRGSDTYKMIYISDYEGGNTTKVLTVAPRSTGSCSLPATYHGKYLSFFEQREPYNAPVYELLMLSIQLSYKDTPPIISGAGQNTSDWADSKTISATVTDSGLGVDRVFWSQSSGATSGTSMSVSGGKYISGTLTSTGTYYIVAYNRFGHRSQTSVSVTNIDRTGPTVSGGKQDVTDWATETTISATAADSQSGVSQVIWSTSSSATSGNAMTRTSGSAASGVYTSTGKITANGTYYIRAKDAVGNWGTAQAVVVDKIDDKAPVIANVALDPEGGFVGSRTITAEITDAGIGVDDARVFLTANVDETDESKGLPLTKGADGKYGIEMAVEGTYYIVAYDKYGNRARSSAIVVKDLDGDPPVMTKIQCRNTSKGFEVSFMLEDAYTGVDNNTVKYGADPAGPGTAAITYNSLKNEYSFILPADGTDYWIFASDKAGNAMAPVQVPRLWLPHVTGTGSYTNDGETGEDIKDGEVGIETYGYIGDIPKTGVDIDGDGTVDAIAPESDMIDVTVPMSVMMYASWDNFSEKKNFVAPVGMVVNNNLTAPVKVEITGFEPESPAGTINLAPMDAMKGDGDIGVLVKPAGSGGAVTFLPTDITAVSADAALQIGTLGGGEGMFYTFEGDYGKGLVQYHKNEQLVCKSVFRFSRA